MSAISNLLLSERIFYFVRGPLDLTRDIGLQWPLNRGGKGRPGLSPVAVAGSEHMRGRCQRGQAQARPLEHFIYVCSKLPVMWRTTVHAPARVAQTASGWRCMCRCVLAHVGMPVTNRGCYVLAATKIADANYRTACRIRINAWRRGSTALADWACRRNWASSTKMQAVAQSLSPRDTDDIKARLL